MGTLIHSIGTAIPPHRLSQAETRDFFIAQPGVDRLAARLIGAAFDHSAIDSRYTVIGELTGGAGPFVDESGHLRVPTTGERNAVYRSEAPALFSAAARDALERARVRAAEVTHVVTASCTGFFAPGPDFRLVQDLGIPPTAQRVHIGFMGCDSAVLELGEFGTAITADGEGDMDWTIGDQGFEMRLTSEVPRIIGREIAGVVRSMLGDGADPLSSIDTWAVHPGGRSVLDRVHTGLELPDEVLDDSRAVLREFGNMSSATVLFILQRILASEDLRDKARVAGLAFGPGLTVETARFTLRKAQ